MTKATKAHEAAEAYRQQIGWGEPEVTINVDGATRRLDIADIVGERAIEYKTGYISKTQEILWEVERDKKLVQQGWNIEWVFEGTPSQPLLQELRDAGIKYKIK
jgi:filamentous hemagglutinin